MATPLTRLVATNEREGVVGRHDSNTINFPHFHGEGLNYEAMHILCRILQDMRLKMESSCT